MRNIKEKLWIWLFKNLFGEEPYNRFLKWDLQECYRRAYFQFFSGDGEIDLVEQEEPVISKQYEGSIVDQITDSIVLAKESGVYPLAIRLTPSQLAQLNKENAFARFDEPEYFNRMGGTYRPGDQIMGLTIILDDRQVLTLDAPS